MVKLKQKARDKVGASKLDAPSDLNTRLVYAIGCLIPRRVDWESALEGCVCPATLHGPPARFAVPLHRTSPPPRHPFICFVVPCTCGTAGTDCAPLLCGS